MIPPRQFLDHVIAPVLGALAAFDPRMHTPAAERLLLGTAVHESGLRDLVQRGGGPALSMFQVEPATFDWLWSDIVLAQPRLGHVVGRFVHHGFSPIAQLAGNQHLACAVARLRFWVVREELPSPTDIDALGRYWKDHYNTRRGAGRAERWTRDFHRHCAEAFQ